MITGAEIVAEAKTWIGTPFVHQGRSRFGVDCIGLVICVRNALSPIPDILSETKDYPRRAKDGMLEYRIKKYCKRIDKPEEGCVILIRWPANKHPEHIGIHAGGNIIHGYARAKKVIETGYRAQWTRDTDSLWRLPGVEP